MHAAVRGPACGSEGPSKCGARTIAPPRLLGERLFPPVRWRRREPRARARAEPDSARPRRDCIDAPARRPLRLPYAAGWAPGLLRAATRRVCRVRAADGRARAATRAAQHRSTRAHHDCAHARAVHDGDGGRGPGRAARLPRPAHAALELQPLRRGRAAAGGDGARGLLSERRPHRRLAIRPRQPVRALRRLAGGRAGDTQRGRLLSLRPATPERVAASAARRDSLRQRRLPRSTRAVRASRCGRLWRRPGAHPPHTRHTPARSGSLLVPLPALPR